MTTINTSDDLIRALRQQPELLETVRTLLFNEELLSLPRQLAEYARITNERLDGLEARMDRLDARVDQFVAATREQFRLVHERLDRLESDVAELKTDVAELKTDVKRLDDNVGGLIGSDLERRTRESILNIAKDELNLTRGRILLGEAGGMDQQLREAIERAEEQGLITGEQVDNLHVADIIIRARRASDRKYIHAVVEVSRTIKDRDIDRAADRADTLAAVVGDEAIAVVIGRIVQPQQVETARRRNTTVLTPTSLETT